MHWFNPLNLSTTTETMTVMAMFKFVLGVLEFEPDKCIPLNEKTISTIISDIAVQLPKIPKKRFTREEIEQKPISKCPINTKKYLDILFIHQAASTNLILAGLRISLAIFTSKITIQFTKTSSK